MQHSRTWSNWDRDKTFVRVLDRSRFRETLQGQRPIIRELDTSDDYGV
jgi:hypothetical protein